MVILFITCQILCHRLTAWNEILIAMVNVYGEIVFSVLLGDKHHPMFFVLVDNP